MILCVVIAEENTQQIIMDVKKLKTTLTIDEKPMKILEQGNREAKDQHNILMELRPM